MDYKNGKIYKLVSNNSDKVYYGSTCSPLCKRLYGHKHDFKRYQEGKKNKITSFQVIRYDDCEIILIENYPCKSKEELHARERYYIENNECVNKVIPTRTRKEYEEVNKEKIKEYREEHKEKTKEYNKQYREENKEIISKNKKQYANEHKEERKEYLQKYRKENKVEITESHDCECGGVYSKQSKARHFKTTRHMKFMNNN